MASQVQPYRGGSGYVARSSSSGLYDVLELILDKGLVIDVFVRVSLIGIEILTVDARIVIASVDTYLRFAEAVNRLDLMESGGGQGLPEMVEGMTESGASSKTKGLVQGAKDALFGDEDESDDEDEGEDKREKRARAADPFEVVGDEAPQAQPERLVERSGADAQFASHRDRDLRLRGRQGAGRDRSKARRSAVSPSSSSRHEDVAALVSRVPGEELEAGREELLTHSRVLEEALGQGVVLPMKFGVVMPSDEVVRKELLEAHHDELMRQLDELEGKVELNVKGIYEEAAVLGEVVTEEPEIARLRAEIAGKPEDATYPQRIRLGELVAEVLEAKRSPGRGDHRLPALAARDRGRRGAARPRAHGRERLLPRRRGLGRGVRRRAERIAAENAERIRFKETGPLPPHSFVELSVEG